MFSKKAQTDIREMLITIVVAGILFIVGLLIFANVSKTTESILDPTTLTQINETINETFLGASDNSTLLLNLGFIENSETVANATDQSKILVRNTDYTITLTGASGDLSTTANFTFIQPGANASYNITEVKATYDYNTQSAAQASVNNLETTVLDSFSLGVISLIVLAAVVILGVLFRLSTG